MELNVVKIKENLDKKARSVVIFYFILKILKIFLRSLGEYRILSKSGDSPLIFGFYVRFQTYLQFLNKFDNYILLNGVTPEAIRFKSLIRLIYRKSNRYNENFYVTPYLKKFIQDKKKQKILLEVMTDNPDRTFLLTTIFALYFPVIYNYLRAEDFKIVKDNKGLFGSESEINKFMEEIDIIYFNYMRFFFKTLAESDFDKKKLDSAVNLVSRMVYFKSLYRILALDLRKTLE